jgi:oligopeptide transport system permease protein
MDRVTMVLAILGVSIPGFILATMVQYAFGYQLSNALKDLLNTDYQFLAIGRWHDSYKWESLKVFGQTLPFVKVMSMKSFLYMFSWDCIRYTLLPAMALGFGSLASVARLMRTSMLDVLHQDYIKTAKAKGLSTTQVTLKHAVRNAILPVVTILGPLTAAILTGTFIIEQIFAIPGLGKFFVQSVQIYDYTMIMGLTIFYASFLILMNFLVDLAYGFIDPRIRLAKGRA